MHLRVRSSLVGLALLVSAFPAPAQQGPGPFPPQSVTDWLNDHAIPIDSVAPGGGFGDLDPLDALVGDARLVAAGEATHGTSEFFQFKHRVFAFLVERLGFFSFAMEAGYAEGLGIDRFLQTGEGTAADAARSTRFWTWSTPEVAAMLQWMRNYNADPAHSRKIRFYGVDMQFPDSAGQWILQYLAQVDPGAVPEATLALARFADRSGRSTYPQLPAAERDADAAALAALIRQFDISRSSYIALSDEESWAFARQAAVVVSQAQQAWANPSMSGEIRDAAMAENALWALARGGGDGRMMLWAHNFHVFSSPIGQYETMGHHLRAALSSSLLVIGQHFDEGRFTAVELLPSPGQEYPYRGLQEFTVGSSAEGSLNDALASTKRPLFVVDIRNAASHPAAGAWWREPHPERSVGAVYAHALDPYTYADVQQTMGYDLLMYVERTTAAQQLPR